MTPHSMLLFDEFGRGTNAIDGMSLCGAVMHKVVGTRTLMATHWNELGSLCESICIFRKMGSEWKMEEGIEKHGYGAPFLLRAGKISQ